MTKHCCVKGCRSESYAGCGISFHSFPKNGVLREKWFQVVGNDFKTKNPLVCSNHFKKDDFRPTQLPTIKKDAVPYIVENTQISPSERITPEAIIEQEIATACNSSPSHSFLSPIHSPNTNETTSQLDLAEKDKLIQKSIDELLDIIEKKNDVIRSLRCELRSYERDASSSKNAAYLCNKSTQTDGTVLYTAPAKIVKDEPASSSDDEMESDYFINVYKSNVSMSDYLTDNRKDIVQGHTKYMRPGSSSENQRSSDVDDKSEDYWVVKIEHIDADDATETYAGEVDVSVSSDSEATASLSDEPHHYLQSVDSNKKKTTIKKT